MAKFFSKYISKLLFLLFLISLLSCNEHRNHNTISLTTKTESNAYQLVSDFGVLNNQYLRKEKYRPNMVVRYKENGYTLAAVKLNYFKDVSLDVQPSKMWADTCPYFYDKVTTHDSGNVKVKINNRDLRSEDGRCAYSKTILNKWEIDLDNFNVLPGDLGIGKAFRVEMRDFVKRYSPSYELHLKKGATFKVSFQLPEIMHQPDSLSMWHFDETNGSWTWEGYAYRSGDHYEANLNSFGLWTSSSKCNIRKVSFKMLDWNFHPLPYSELTIVSKKPRVIRYDISTDMYGVCTAYLDRDVPYKVLISGFSVPTYSSEWPFEESYTHIEYPSDAVNWVCDIEPGDDDLDLKFNLLKHIKTLYQDYGLSYDQLPQHYGEGESSWDKDLTKPADDAEEEETTADKKQYESSGIMSKPLPDVVAYRLHRGQTYMGKCDTLEMLDISKGESTITFVPHKTRDTIVADLSCHINTFSVDRFPSGGNELYRLNWIGFFAFERERDCDFVSIQYRKLNASNKPTEAGDRYEDTFRQDSVLYTEKFYFSSPISYEFEYYTSNGDKRQKTLSEITKDKLIIGKDSSICLKVTGTHGRELKVKSLKDKYNNNLLVNPKYGIVNPKAFKSNELTFEFDDKDDVFNSTITVHRLRSSNFQGKSFWPIWLMLFVMIAIALYMYKKKVVDQKDKKESGKDKAQNKSADSERTRQSNPNGVVVNNSDVDGKKREKEKGHKNSTRLDINLALLIANVVNMGPAFDDRHKRLIKTFQNEIRLNVNLELLVEECRNQSFDLDSVLSNLQSFDKGRHTELMRLLYKIAATDDGIKNDEWDLLDKIMVGLNARTRLIKKMHRRYEPLRSERDSSNKSEEENKSKQSDYANNKEEQSGNSKQESKKISFSTANKAYFTVLGIPADSTLEQVKSAYRTLAKTWHPDLPKNADNQAECVRKMAEINIAYEEIMKRVG